LRALELAGLAPSDVDVLIPHQANLRNRRGDREELRAKGAREDMAVADDRQVFRQHFVRAETDASTTSRLGRAA